MDRSPARLARVGPALGAALAIVLALPALNAPLLQDDVVHRAMLEGKLQGLEWGPFELYDFVGGPTRPVTLQRDNGYMPWFAADDLKLRFFRPLSSALLAADSRTFGERVWASRVHSLAWFLVIIALTSALHRRVLPAATAGLATLIYAIAVGHAMPISWLAARHALIATAFALASVCLHLRGREDGSLSARWLSVFALAAALLAGEVALGGVALIASYELLHRRDPLVVRLRAILPAVLVAAAYLGFYLAMGYGARGGGAYIGPDSGVAGALAAVRHLLILGAELIAATPSDAFSMATNAVQVGGALWGAATAGLAWTLFRVLREHFEPRELRALRWLPLAAAAAAVPGAFGVVGGRVLTLALVPASGAVAAVLVAGASSVRRRRLEGLRRAFVAVAVGGLAFAHLVVAPMLRGTLALLLTDLATLQHRLAASTSPCKGIMVLVAMADPAVAIYVPATMLLRDRGPQSLRILSMAPADHRIERVTVSGFDLVMLDPARTWSFWELVCRRGPMPAGTRVILRSLDAVVLEDSGGIPVRVRFDFGEPLDSPRLCFYQWRDGALMPLRAPAPGDTVLLRHEKGPTGW